MLLDSDGLRNLLRRDSMRRIIKALPILCVVCCLTVISARAASENYTISQMDLTVSIPSSYDVFTRNMPNNSPLLSEYGISHSDLVKQFAAGSTYLDAVAPDGSEEIVVTMMEEDILSDFNGLGDTTLLTLASALKDEYSDYGLSISSYDIYHHQQLEFIRIYFSAIDRSTHSLQYYTTYDGKAMNFTIHSYVGSISSAQEKTIKDIVDSVNLHSYTPIALLNEELPSFIYTDNETGTTFTVPANWRAVDFSEEREYLDAKFSFADDPGLLITYSSADLWAELSFVERLLTSRSKSDELLLSSDDSETYRSISEMFGIPESSINKRTYNGEIYYIFDAPYTSELYGMNFSTTLTQAIHVENGMAYYFQFNGNEQHFDDFEKVLQSVEYGIKGATGSSAFVIIIIAIAIIAVIVIVIRKKKASQKAVETAGQSEETIGGAPSLEYIYCHRCGNKLPIDSSFCISCGTRLIEKENDQ